MKINAQKFFCFNKKCYIYTIIKTDQDMLKEFRERMKKEITSQGYVPQAEFKPTFKLSQLVDIEVEGIDTSDFPDFCDAFISSAAVETWDGEYRELTDGELDWINSECLDFVHEEVYKTIY